MAVAPLAMYSALLMWLYTFEFTRATFLHFIVRIRTVCVVAAQTLRCKIICLIRTHLFLAY